VLTLFSERDSLLKIRDGGGVEVQTHVVRDKVKRSRRSYTRDQYGGHVMLSYQSTLN
jgi:hypothetical protein